MLSFIDTHAHLTDNRYDEVRDFLIKNLNKENIKSVFCVAYDNETIKSVTELSEKYENVYAIIGVHPDGVNEYTNATEELIRSMAKSPKVIGIGEIGLDYLNLPENETYRNQIISKQKEIFVKQISLANELNLPLIIHTRDSVSDTIEILKENCEKIRNGGILHCFGESADYYYSVKNLNFLVSVGGIVTFKNGSNIVNLVENLSMNNIVLETDCPYLTPVPYRGKCINEPKFINVIASKIAEIKNVSLEEVSEITNLNVKKLFKKYKG